MFGKQYLAPVARASSQWPAVALCAAILALWTTAAQAEAVKVKRAFPPGTYVITAVSKSVGEVGAGEEKSKIDSEDTTVWEFTVGQPNDKGEKKMAAKIKSLKRLDKNDASECFDSEKPMDGQNEAAVFVYKPLVGFTAQVLLDADDTVVEVTGLDKMWVAMEERADDAQKIAISGAAAEFSDKVMEQMLRRLESVAPKNAVNVGDTWKAGMRVVLPHIGEIKSRYDCTFKGVENGPAGDVACIDCQAVHSIAGAKTSKLGPIDITITKLDGKETGTVKVDTKTGMLAGDEQSIDMAVEFKFTADGKETNGTVKVNEKNVTTVAPRP